MKDEGYFKNEIKQICAKFIINPFLIFTKFNFFPPIQNIKKPHKHASYLKKTEDFQKWGLNF